MEEQVHNTTETSVADTEQTKAARALENLRMRLLDLTARNRLINFRHTKRASLRVIDELPDQLVEMLLADKELRFLAVPEPTREALIAAGYIAIDDETGQEVRLKKDPTAEEWAKHLGLSTDYAVPEPSDEAVDARHTDTAIQTLLYPYELETRLKNLLQTANSAIEEMGANILYMAFGFMEWFDSSGDTARLAPLFLVPARLHKGRLDQQTKTYIYTLSYSGEDIIPNLSLREKLRLDFALALPELDENTTPEAYFRDVQSLIEKNQPRWRVRRFVSLTLLNFSKLLMYLDLDPARWPGGDSILDHRVVTRFLAGYETTPDEKGIVGFGEEYAIDEMDGIHQKYPLIDDADSSQHSALIDAIDGKDLVIEGPPGTGKSQTITNLIAAAIAQGKRVLFVAEKLAALEVVRRRLDNAGLGDFCLELHSHKSQKRKVLDEVAQRLDKQGKYRDPREIDVDIARYEELKTQLKDHVERINQPWKSTGKTLHEIFMAATRYREALDVAPDSVHPAGYDGENFDPTMQRRAEDQVEGFGKVYTAIAAQLVGDTDLQSHPWYGVRNTDLQIFDLDRVIAELTNWQTALSGLVKQLHAIAEGLDCATKDLVQTLYDFTALLEDLECVPALHGNELLDSLPALRGDYLLNARRYLDLFNKIQATYLALAEVVDSTVLNELDRVDRIASAGDQLRQLVSPAVDLATLASAVRKLVSIDERLGEFSEPLAQIQAAVGPTPANLLQPTEVGLNELATFIELAGALDAAHWKKRDDLFDNDELDTLLPKMQRELTQLDALRDDIGRTFNIASLPAANVLHDLGQTLVSGGLFGWFSGTWRAARRQLLGLAANQPGSFDTLLSQIGWAVDYANQTDTFATNTAYRQALGGHFNGIETDAPGLLALRSWYVQVRHTYGIGFGKRVALGDTLLDLPVNLARAIRSLADRNVPEQIRSLLGDLQQIKPVFAPVSELQADDTTLIGADGTLSRLLDTLNRTLPDCSPVAADSSAKVTQVLERIEKLKGLKKTLVLWDRSDFDRKVFDGRLGLKTGLNADNQAGIAAAANTFDLATTLDQQIQIPALQAYLYANLRASTFVQVRGFATQLDDSIAAYSQTLEAFTDLVSLDTDAWINQCGDQLDALIARNQQALDNAPSLQNWLDYVRVRDELEDMGLISLAEAVEQRRIAIEQVEDAHKAGVYDILAREILREQPALGRFSGHSQRAIQSQFADYDNKLKGLQCERIAWQVDQQEAPSGIPGPRVSDRTELYLLQHEVGKKTRHLPIRQLLARAGESLAALKPCFMMGPMSVAQYLAPGQIAFDLVVMDEASQIKPQDALGAIARGVQIVVVGDPKQLPPTSFFDRVVDDDETDPTGIEESESILEATMPMFPGRRLRWHYRSQHENLIAFSNHSFYHSDLVVFPSPHKETDDYGIQFTSVPRGCFVNRRNMEEAHIISEAVREHFRHRPDESLGVVAMSADQRQQIERAIEVLAKEDSVFAEQLEKDAGNTESLFIKNLENVQGDERDVIYISMTYGPQEPGGRVMQRFGPINSDVGWRRLNVLFTRSKKRMHIFSSMASSDIIAGGTAKRGVQALHDFLRFCETGILHKTERETGRGPDSDFEIAVTAALRDAGFECIPQVGVAGFFIDVAVVDPGNPGRYLMGIECDGATYHSAKSVRDRDRLRQAVLERLGWNIRRIWSTDWFKNPQAELQPILRELNTLKSAIPTVVEDVVESESDEIEEIVERTEDQEAETASFLDPGISLKERIIAFDRDVIRPAQPDTPQNRRLLRPAMIEALVEYAPTSKTEFFESIPGYLRQATEPSEGQYLDQVFEIINAALEDNAIDEENADAD